MKKWILPILGTIVLSGCSAKAVLVKKNVAYDPKTEARVRVFNQNGNVTTRISSDTTCNDYRHNPAKKPSRNPFSAENTHNGLPKFTLKNFTIGIPTTERSANVLNRDSFSDTDTFNEFVVAAGKPALIRGSTFFGSSTYSMGCSVAGEFTPKAGTDYELDYDIVGKYCRLFVYELDTKNSQFATLQEVSYKRCPKD